MAVRAKEGGGAVAGGGLAGGEEEFGAREEGEAGGVGVGHDMEFMVMAWHY